MIGKRLTSVKEDSQIDDVELMAEIKQMKEALKKKWTDIHLKAKATKDSESTASSEK